MEEQKIDYSQLQQLPQQGQSAEQLQQQEEKKAQMQEMRESILTQIMTHDARERCIILNLQNNNSSQVSRIKLAKPEKAQQIENQLIMSAQKGMLQDKISEQQLIGLLEKISGTKKETKIQIKRKGFGGIDDDF